MVNYLKSSFLSAIVLLWRAYGFKNKVIIFNYIAHNILHRFLGKVKLPREVFVDMKDLKFWFAARQSELAPYLEIYCYRIYELDNRFILKSNEIVFDVGGHIGFFAIRQAKRLRGGKVFVFEPNPDTFSRLLKNIQENKLKNIYPFNKAVTFREGKVILRLSRGSSEAATIMDQGTAKNYDEKIQIETISLDQIVKEYQIPKIHLMKIDAEGAELEVLKSGLKNALPLTEKIIIETHSSRLKNEVEKILRSFRFKVVLKVPSGQNTLGRNTLIYLSRI
jgi:FkbM family methyltransferase